MKTFQLLYSWHAVPCEIGTFTSDKEVNEEKAMELLGLDEDTVIEKLNREFGLKYDDINLSKNLVVIEA